MGKILSKITQVSPTETKAEPVILDQNNIEGLPQQLQSISSALITKVDTDGGNATGTWGISTTGNAATATNASHATSATYYTDKDNQSAIGTIEEALAGKADKDAVPQNCVTYTNVANKQVTLGSIVSKDDNSGSSTLTFGNSQDANGLYVGSVTSDNRIVVKSELDAKQDSSTAITTSNIGSQSVSHAATAGNASKLENSTKAQIIAAAKSGLQPSGDYALKSEIPTDNNQLKNGAGYITSSGSCSHATTAGSATSATSANSAEFLTSGIAKEGYECSIEDILVHNGTGKVNAAQYADNAGGVAWENTNHPSTFPPSKHDHNDLYYTESEMNTKLAGKVSTSTTVNGHALTGNIKVTASDVGLGNVNNTADSEKSVNYATSAGSAGSATSANSASFLTSGISKTDYECSIEDILVKNGTGKVNAASYADTAGTAGTANNVAWANTNHPSTFPPSKHDHNDLYYTESEMDSKLSGKVPTSRTVNGHALTGNVTVTASDVGLGNVNNTADSVKSVNYATSANSAGFLTSGIAKEGYECSIEDILVHNGTGKVNAAQYADNAGGVAWENTNHPSTFPPSKHDHNDLYYTESEMDSKLSGKQNVLSTSNKLPYSYISGTPTIPTDNNQLTNGAGYITSSGSCKYATSAGSAGSATSATTADSATSLTGGITKSGYECSIEDIFVKNGTGKVNAAQYATSAGSASNVAWANTNHPSTFPPETHYHSASEITSGTLEIARGGTGATTASGAKSNLGLGSVRNVASYSETESEARYLKTRYGAETKSVTLDWSGSFNNAQAAYLLGWNSSGDTIKAVAKSDLEVGYATSAGSAGGSTYAAHLGTSGGSFTYASLGQALLAKVPTSRTVNGHALTGNVTVTAGDIGLGKVNNTADSEKSVKSATTATTASNYASSGTIATALGKKQDASSAITTSNIGSQRVSYATSAGSAGSATSATSANSASFLTSGISKTDYECSIEDIFVKNGTGKVNSASYANTAGTANNVAWANTNHPSTFPPETHDHNDLYYTESEMDSKLSGKQNVLSTSNKLPYSYISGTPTIPTDNNQLTNGAGYISTTGSEVMTHRFKWASGTSDTNQGIMPSGANMGYIGTSSEYWYQIHGNYIYGKIIYLNGSPVTSLFETKDRVTMNYNASSRTLNIHYKG